MPHIEIKFKEWIMKSMVTLVDSVGNSMALLVPMLFVDPDHLRDPKLWTSLAMSVALISFKTMVIAFKDFKQYVIEKED